MKYCTKCGKEIMDESAICPGCGCAVGQTAAEQSAQQPAGQPVYQQPPVENSFVVPALAKNKMPLIIGAAVAVVAVIAVVVVVLLGGGSSGPDFKKIYDEYCKSTWASFGEDGSYLKIDTNPDDKEDSGMVCVDAGLAIEEVNKELGLPDSLYSDMGETTWSMGKQNETFDEIGITVSWTYHPDKGLEVIYKKVN